MEKTNIEVNSGTCAIIALDKERCKIISETGKDQVVKKTPAEVMEYGCRYFGSSFAGRVEGAKFLLGARYKVPIIMEEHSELIFLPTYSYRNSKCDWIALNHIDHYEKDGYGVRIKFNSGRKLFLPVSFDSLEAQIFRATKLLLTLKKSKQKK